MKIKDIVENFSVTSKDARGITLTDKVKGITLTVPPDQAAAFQIDPQNPNKFSMNQQALQQTPNAASPDQLPGPKVGAEVELSPNSSETMGTEPHDQQNQGMTPQPMGETQEDEDEYDREGDDLIGSGKDGDIGGDPTDNLISDVEDKEFTRFARGNITKPSKKELAENDELARWLTIARLR